MEVLCVQHSLSCKRLRDWCDVHRLVRVLTGGRSLRCLGCLLSPARHRPGRFCTVCRILGKWVLPRASSRSFGGYQSCWLLIGALRSFGSCWPHRTDRCHFRRRICTTRNSLTRTSYSAPASARPAWFSLHRNAGWSGLETERVCELVITGQGDSVELARVRLLVMLDELVRGFIVVADVSYHSSHRVVSMPTLAR